MDKKKPKKKSASGDDTKFPGYPHYPEKEDIYSKEHKEELAEDKDEDKDMGLVVPGSGLDNKEEEIGEEDEENNYYSLGGDEHNKLEEAPDE